MLLSASLVSLVAPGDITRDEVFQPHTVYKKLLGFHLVLVLVFDNDGLGALHRVEPYHVSEVLHLFLGIPSLVNLP